MVYSILKNTLGLFIRCFMSEIKGRENIPKDKAFIIACNHASFYDDLAVPSVVVPFVNKKIHFYVSHIYYKNYFLKKFLELIAEAIPIAANKVNNTKKINQEGLKKALGYLKKNEIVGIFPEGTRSVDGKIRKPKTGIAYLLLKGKVPVLPIGIKGSDKILPKGASFPRFKKCKVKIGKLMYFNNFFDKKANKRLLTKITNDIMKEVAKLSEQEYNFQKWHI